MIEPSEYLGNLKMFRQRLAGQLFGAEKALWLWVLTPLEAACVLPILLAIKAADKINRLLGADK